jgi:hypothetical protein
MTEHDAAIDRAGVEAAALPVLVEGMICECGNTDCADGFVACDATGLEMDADELWARLGCRYACQKCGKQYRAPEPEGQGFVEISILTYEAKGNGHYRFVGNANGSIDWHGGWWADVHVLHTQELFFESTNVPMDHRESVRTHILARLLND